jgi:hypothetical protein
MSRVEWWISLYVAVLCFLSYRLTLEVKYLKEDGVTIRNAPWSVLQPAVSMWQRPRRAVSAHNITSSEIESPAVSSPKLSSQAAAPLGLHLHGDNGTCSCKVSKHSELLLATRRASSVPYGPTLLPSANCRSRFCLQCAAGGKQ